MYVGHTWVDSGRSMITQCQAQGNGNAVAWVGAGANFSTVGPNATRPSLYPGANA